MIPSSARPSANSRASVDCRCRVSFVSVPAPPLRGGCRSGLVYHRPFGDFDQPVGDFDQPEPEQHSLVGFQVEAERPRRVVHAAGAVIVVRVDLSRVAVDLDVCFVDVRVHLAVVGDVDWCGICSCSIISVLFLSPAGVVGNLWVSGFHQMVRLRRTASDCVAYFPTRSVCVCVGASSSIDDADARRSHGRSHRDSSSDAVADAVVTA